MKRDSLDRLFSLVIRTRDHFTCRRCFAKHERNSQGLHACHIFGRGKRSTRWDVQNAFAACYGCHRLLDTHPSEKERWVISWMGREDYERLMFKAHHPSKPDVVMLKLHLTELLERLARK